MPTAASHISCVLRWLGISFIQRGIASYRVILIYIIGSGEGQNMPWGVAFVSDNLKQLSVTSTTFLSVFSHLQEHILMDASQLVLTFF